MSPLPILYANRTVRTFGYGLTSVVLGIFLARLGANSVEVVAALGVSLIGGAALNAATGLYGDRFGRRRSMILFGGLMAASGAILATAPGLVWAIAGLALGAMSPSGSEIGPFLSLEQSIIADAAPSGRRARSFGVYNFLGTIGAAFGALASLAVTLPGSESVIPTNLLRLVFGVYAGVGIVAVGIARRLPDSIERDQRQPRTPLSVATRTRVGRLAGLFGVDGFAGGLVLQSFVSYWFYNVFPGSRAILGSIFFAANLAAGLSLLLAARLGERYGLLETMVFTHLPSNVLLILVPLAPTFPLALAAYLARMSLSQMDVPTRQAYLAGIVGPSERTAANAATNSARNITQAGGPFAAGLLISVLSLSAPFFAGGILKIGYDLGVFATFRSVRPEGS